MDFLFATIICYEFYGPENKALEDIDRQTNKQTEATRI